MRGPGAAIFVWVLGAAVAAGGCIKDLPTDASCSKGGQKLCNGACLPATDCCIGTGCGGTADASAVVLVHGGLATSAPADASGGTFLVQGGFAFGPLMCSAEGVCVTGGIVP